MSHFGFLSVRLNTTYTSPYSVLFCIALRKIDCIIYSPLEIRIVAFWVAVCKIECNLYLSLQCLILGCYVSVKYIPLPSVSFWIGFCEVTYPYQQSVSFCIALRKTDCNKGIHSPQNRNFRSWPAFDRPKTSSYKYRDHYL